MVGRLKIFATLASASTLFFSSVGAMLLTSGNSHVKLMTQDKFYEKLTPENSEPLLIDHQAAFLFYLS